MTTSFRSTIWSASTRTLVTGATGRLGTHVMQLLRQVLPGDRLLAVASSSSYRGGPHPVFGVDLRDRDAVLTMVREWRPHVILHLAALSSVGVAETDHRRALEVNAIATCTLREGADAVGAHMLYVSTDFVFDGEAGGYAEADVTRPANHYGRTKRLGELALGDRHLVVRLPLLFGRAASGSPTQFDRQLDALRDRRPLQAYDDEFRTPLSFRHAARAIVELAALRYAGIAHVAGAERVTPEQLLHAYADGLGIAEPAIAPTSRLSALGPPRPRDVSLNCQRLSADVPDLLALPLAHEIATELGRTPNNRIDKRSELNVISRSGPAVTTSQATVVREPNLTVFVPAHQNADTLARCLTSLAAQSILQRVAVRAVVICNGCTDETVAVAEKWTPALIRAGIVAHVLELPAPGRASALNVGEAAVGPVRGPRVYLDGDAYLSPKALEHLEKVLASGTGVEFAGLRVEATASHSVATRAYARLWSSVPYVTRASATMGVYAVSEEGRERWNTFPTLHSDDKWVRLHFAPRERAIVDAASYTIQLPEGIRSLYRARLRYERGNHELIRRFPDLCRQEPPRYSGLGVTIARDPHLWAPAAVIGAIQGVALLRRASRRTA